jgi:ribosomal protein S18 acetylase RimI-like enzyme
MSGTPSLQPLRIQGSLLAHGASRVIPRLVASSHRTHYAVGNNPMPDNLEIEIRKLTRDDAHIFWRLRLEALEHDPRAFTESPEQHRKLSLEAVAERLGSDSGPDAKDHRDFVLGAFVDDHLVGMAGFFRHHGLKTQHKGHIWGVYVQAASRGKGIAHVLLSELLRRAQSLPGLGQVTLAVSTDQPAAQKLYSSLGFKSYGREARALKVDDTYTDEDLMVLRFD